MALSCVGQFDPADQATAIELLYALKFVSRDSFIENLRKLILSRLIAGDSSIGLYAERELRRRHGIPFRLFKEPRTKIKRATGETRWCFVVLSDDFATDIPRAWLLRINYLR
jgi:hypothetical protein